MKLKIAVISALIIFVFVVANIIAFGILQPQNNSLGTNIILPDNNIIIENKSKDNIIISQVNTTEPVAQNNVPVNLPVIPVRRTSAS